MKIEMLAGQTAVGSGMSRSSVSAACDPQPPLSFRLSCHSTPHITGSKKQSEERAALLAAGVHVIFWHLSISAETLMEQVNQVSSIPDSSALLTSVAPRVEKFESLGVSENLLQ